MRYRNRSRHAAARSTAPETLRVHLWADRSMRRRPTSSAFKMNRSARGHSLGWGLIRAGPKRAHNLPKILDLIDLTMRGCNLL